MNLSHWIYQVKFCWALSRSVSLFAGQSTTLRQSWLVQWILIRGAFSNEMIPSTKSDHCQFSVSQEGCWSTAGLALALWSGAETQTRSQILFSFHFFYVSKIITVEITSNHTPFCCKMHQDLRTDLHSFSLVHLVIHFLCTALPPIKRHIGLRFAGYKLQEFSSKWRVLSSIDRLRHGIYALNNTDKFAILKPFGELSASFYVNTYKIHCTCSLKCILRRISQTV
jgi:hypothetical protein